jgi:hypothetical protein
MARLTDNNGRKADFRNVILVMTTNAGAETLQRATIGFTNAREAGDEMGDIKRLFTPEFRNRLDGIIGFKSLDESIILRVVDKFLLQLETQLAEKKVEASFSDALRKMLAKKGFDPLMGARPMQRLIQDTIRRALADELLFGRLVDGGRLTVDMDADDQIGAGHPAAAQERQTARRGCGRLISRELAAGARPPVQAPGPAGSSARASRTTRGARRACGPDRRRSSRWPRQRIPLPTAPHTRPAPVQAPSGPRVGQKRSNTSRISSGPLVRQFAADRCGPSSGTPSATPSAMSSTWANSWMTTL